MEIAKKSLKKEVEMIEEDEIKTISTDVIESLFRKYKLFSQKSFLKQIMRMLWDNTDINITNNERTDQKIIVNGKKC